LDGPLRKNEALDEQLAELDARLPTLQRNIAAKRLARGSIKSAEQHRRQANNLRYSDMLDLRNRASLKLTPPELAPTIGWHPPQMRSSKGFAIDFRGVVNGLEPA
jgi:hypothetical protein